ISTFSLNQLFSLALTALWIGTCSGETVPRASRDRRKKAMNASSDAEVHSQRHDLAKDMTWGREFSLCERAGSKIENNRKILDNTLKV
ncbi:4712_t:CDS:2, partial [Rhizophagus irregularis]